MKTRQNQRIEQIIELIFKTGRIMRGRMSAKNRLNPSTILQIHALQFITETPGGTMKQLAGQFTITPASATSLVDRLLAQDLVRRIPSLHDRRIVHLALTPKGQALHLQHINRFKKSMASIFGKLNPKSQEELIHVLTELNTIYKNK